MSQSLADATVKVECGGKAGSGFHFLRPEIIVTNHHIVEDLYLQPNAVTAVAEDGRRFPLTYVTHSPKTDYDYAIFSIGGQVPSDRNVLVPKVLDQIQRGMEVLFAGFPHGIDDLLVQKAMVSGPSGDVGFYLDGSVNEGNSGGPIVDPSTGEVVGIVTRRRFLGTQDLEQMAAKADALAQYCQQIAAQGRVEIMGIDFGALTQMFARSNLLIRDVIRSNANSGLGIGFKIRYVLQQCANLGLAPRP